MSASSSPPPPATPASAPTRPQVLIQATGLAPAPATQSVEPAAAQPEAPAATPPKPIPAGVTESSDHEEIPLERKNHFLYVGGLVLTVGLLTSTMGLLYFRTQQVELPVSSPVVEVITPSLAPLVASSSSQLKRAEISLEILNGSGKTGLASQVKASFEELGYTVKTIGNADPVAEGQLIVRAQDQDMLEILLADVETELKITGVTKVEEDLVTTAKIILGPPLD